MDDIKLLRERAHQVDQEVKALRDRVKRYAEEAGTKEAWEAYGALNAATYDTFGAFGSLCLISSDCEFVQHNPHEWYCTIHDSLKIAGTSEPVFCDKVGVSPA